MKKKNTVITFKVDDDLLKVLDQIPNRSAFIRMAVVTALEDVCPLCGGTGRLTPNQQRHWRDFAEDHIICTCRECHEKFILCSHSGDKRPS